MNVALNRVTNGMTVARAARRRVRFGAFVLVIALLVQFAAGMVVNLFVQIPAHHPGSSPSEYFGGSALSVYWAITGSGQPFLIFHAVWGLLLVARGLGLVFETRGVGRRAITVAALLGFLFTLGAGFNGASFLDFNEDFSSMIMAALFALAMASYASILFLVANEG